MKIGRFHPVGGQGLAESRAVGPFSFCPWVWKRVKNRPTNAKFGDVCDGARFHEIELKTNHRSSVIVSHYVYQQSRPATLLKVADEHNLESDCIMDTFMGAENKFTPSWHRRFVDFFDEEKDEDIRRCLIISRALSAAYSIRSQFSSSLMQYSPTHRILWQDLPERRKNESPIS